MPNIGAFIAWGFIAAIFIDNGWFPNKQLSQLAGPMISYLIPLLIAFSGGRLIHGLRGGIIAATSTMGVISITRYTNVTRGYDYGAISRMANEENR